MPDSPGNLKSETSAAWPPRPDHPNGTWQNSLPGLLSVLRQRRQVLIATILLVPLCAFLVLQQVTLIYKATGALIYRASDYQGTARREPISEATMASQAEVLQSLRIAQRVAERGNLYADPFFNISLGPPRLLSRAWSTLRLLLGMEADDAPADTAAGPTLD